MIDTEIEVLPRGEITESTVVILEVCGCVPMLIENALVSAGYLSPSSLRLSDIPRDHTYHGGWIKKTIKANVPEELSFLRGFDIDLGDFEF